MQVTQVVITGQNRAELQTQELDDRNLGPDEFLVQTEYSFISAGTELSIFTGTEAKVRQAGSWCAYPWNAGYANVGIVRAVGTAVTSLKPGQRVFTCCPHAAWVRSSQKSLVVPVPEALDPVLAVASRMAGVATTVLYVTEVRESPWTAVFGLGMVGNLAAQALQIRGCRVIGIDPNAARRELASQCGIRKVIGGSATDVQEQIRTLTGGRGVGIAVDAVGHSAVVQSALAVTADYGQLILLGSPRVPVQANLTEFLSDVHMRWITVRGALEWNLPAFTPGNAWGIPTLHPESLASKQEMIFHWLLDGQMTVAPLVSHRLPPQQIQKAYEGLLRQPEAYTGVVLDWR